MDRRRWRPRGADPAQSSRLQAFLWYDLPRKWLVPLEEKQAVAARLGRFLELVGGRAAAYAAICASDQTLRMIQAWEDGDPAAGELLRDALDATGIEPPDTDALEWSSLMGLDEVRLRGEIALALERAVEDGQLDPEGRDFKRRRAQLMKELLGEPRGDDGWTPLDVIGEERLERWARQGSDERQAIVAPLVRAAVERFPGWWEERFGPPNREDEVSRLRGVDDLAHRMRLVRRRGRKLTLTARGRAACEEPAGLLQSLAPGLLPAEGFDAAVQELAAALLLRDQVIVDADEMERAVHAAIVAEGWNASGEPPGLWDVAAVAFDLVRVADALGLIEYEYEYDRESGSARRHLTMAPDGREALRLALRARATGPTGWP